MVSILKKHKLKLWGRLEKQTLPGRQSPNWIASKQKVRKKMEAKLRIMSEKNWGTQIESLDISDVGKTILSFNNVTQVRTKMLVCSGFVDQGTSQKHLKHCHIKNRNLLIFNRIKIAIPWITELTLTQYTID